jgi:hypothetical protein
VKEKLSQLMREYGRLAVSVYFALFLAVFLAVLGGFYVAIASGFQTDGVAENMSTVGAAWVATKLTQPIRIGATLLLTPLLAAFPTKASRSTR